MLRWTHTSRQIHWCSARVLRHRRNLRRGPSTLPQRCSACEGVCPPALCCGGRRPLSRAPERSAPHLKESQGRTPSGGWWPDSAGRKWTRPSGTRKLRCQRWPRRIWSRGQRSRSNPSEVKCHAEIFTSGVLIPVFFQTCMSTSVWVLADTEYLT